MIQVPREVRERAVKAVEKAIGSFDRRPFQQVLATLIGAAPTMEALETFAARYPDKWAQAVTMFAGLAGYEKGQVSLNFFNVAAMSDVALLAELAKGDEHLRKLGLARAPITIENPPQAEAGAPPLPKILGATADSAQDIGRPPIPQNGGYVPGTAESYEEKLARAPGPAAPGPVMEP